jgi:thiosulfate reductase/polysulfide reductase chain A
MAETSSIYSLCGMCAVRCPIRVETDGGVVTWIEGSPHVPGIEGALCAKGSAGLAFEYDTERPQYPMIRTGPRGSGQWRKASWDETLDYITEKLTKIRGQYGAKAIALADRGGLFTDLTKSFVKAIGSPNYFDHDDTCAKNVNMACQSVLGYGRGDMGYDFANTKHIVLYGRNIFESLQVKEVNDVLNAMEKGAKLTYIDIRATVTAAKADTFLQIRPGTDYALNLALINIILQNKLYDIEFVDRYVTGIEELKQFVLPYTAEWAQQETGIPAQSILTLAHHVNEARPKVIFHGGWMLSRYIDSFYSSRTLHILNVLMGNIEAKGGIIIAKGPKDAQVKGLKSLGASIPEVADKIVDADMPGKSLGTGHVVNLYKAIKTGEPYPVKALFAYRYDPMASLPDPEAQKIVFDNLDLLVSIDVNYSETSWYADVILPEATYLERSNIIATKKGPKPAFIMRRQAIPPLYDSKPAWEIFSLLARRMGAELYFPYTSIEQIWEYQLEGTNIAIDDFTAKGQVALCKEPIMMSRDALVFPTQTGKIELVSKKMAGTFAFLAPYVSPRKPGQGEFRLTFGRSGAQSHAQSQNNLYLNEITAENTLWLNDREADKLGISHGEIVEVSTEGYSGRIKANVTPFIHPEAVFMLHGYGSEIPLKTRSYQKGVRDTKLQTGLLETVDPVGGGVAYMECMVKVTKILSSGKV